MERLRFVNTRERRSGTTIRGLRRESMPDSFLIEKNKSQRINLRWRRDNVGVIALEHGISVRAPSPPDQLQS